jgi:type IV pilus assembly protein PilA
MALLRALRPKDQGNDSGFTLIELLIVIIIIGILAAVAIPVYLNQRKKGHDAAAKSDLRNLANFEEIYFSENGTYAKATVVEASEPHVQSSQGIELGVVQFNRDAYCLSARNTDSSRIWYWDSLGGGLQPADSPGCPKVNDANFADLVDGDNLPVN